MSVGLYRYSGDINDKNTELIFSENISSEVFYQRYWVKAICESKVKLFKDGCDFDVGDLNIIMSELNALGAWATENLSGIDLKYMSERIENLKSVLPQACKCKGGKFYIFKYNRKILFG